MARVGWASRPSIVAIWTATATRTRSPGRPAETWHDYVGNNIYQDLAINIVDPNHPVAAPTAPLRPGLQPRRYKAAVVLEHQPLEDFDWQLNLSIKKKQFFDRAAFGKRAYQSAAKVA